MALSREQADSMDSPAFECPAYKTMTPRVNFYRDLLGGTETMRAKSTDYLPQHPAEKDDDYAIRLQAAVLFNAVQRTKEGLTGMVFRKDPTLGEDTPDRIKNEIWQNVDLRGTTGPVFAREVFEDGFDGHSLIFVDKQRAITDENAQAKANAERGDGRVSAADEIKANLRPYWIKVRLDQVINWVEEQVNGALALTQVTIRECVKERVGDFGETEVEQFRVLRPNYWAVYRWKEATVGRGRNKKSAESLEIHVDKNGDRWEGDTGIDEVPLSVHYGGRKEDTLESRPRLSDLCYENVEHYQLRADLRHVLHVANVPILWAAGLADEDFEVGPNSFAKLEEQGKMCYAEHAGHAIGKAMEERAACEQRMAILGLLLLMGKPQVEQTATQSVIESEAESSELANMARSLQDAIDGALRLTAKYLGLDEG